MLTSEWRGTGARAWLTHVHACRLSLATFPSPITLRVALIKCLYTRTNYNSLRATMLSSEWRGTWLTHVTQEAPRVDGVKSSQALRGLGIGRLRARGGREAARPCPLDAPL